MLKKIINYLRNNQIDCFTLSHSTMKPAFTLAETLIVMGIIGVVAALTLPNLNSSTGEKEKVAKVKKIYSNLQDAYGRARAVYGPIDDWRKGATRVSAVTFGERITEFMKISKNCGSTSNQGCFSSSNVKNVNNSESTTNLETMSYATVYRFITTDGTSILINQPPVDSICIYIDIDGPNKGQNKYGSDIFKFFIYYGNLAVQAIQPDEIVPYGFNNDYASLLSNLKSTGDYAATWVLNYDNMDYLKLGSDGKCPDGKTILDGVSNTTCK